MQNNNLDFQIAEYMKNNNYLLYADSYKPLVDTGRKQVPVMKYPTDLDFSKNIGGTTYIVKSSFNKTANECMTQIVLRWINNNTDVS